MLAYQVLCTALFKLMKTRKLLLLLLAIYLDSDDSNQGKDLELGLTIAIFFSKGPCRWKFVQQLKTMIHVAVLGREATLLYTWL